MECGGLKKVPLKALLSLWMENGALSYGMRVYMLLVLTMWSMYSVMLFPINGIPYISAFTCENIELKVDRFNINEQCNIVVSHKYQLYCNSSIFHKQREIYVIGLILLHFKNVPKLILIFDLAVVASFNDYYTYL